MEHKRDGGTRSDSRALDCAQGWSHQSSRQKMLQRSRVRMEESKGLDAWSLGCLLNKWKQGGCGRCESRVRERGLTGGGNLGVVDG